MLDAIRKARVRLLAAEVEVGLAGMADRPFADAVVEVEQAGLVGDFGARLGRDQAARRRRRDRRLLIAGPLADEAAGTDRAVLHPSAPGRGLGAAPACCARGAAGAAARAPRRRGGGLGRPAAAGGRRGFPFLSSPGFTGDGRCSRPRRCALPITALRLTPPSSSAIWLAVDAIVPHLFQALDALVSPRHCRIAPFRLAAPCGHRSQPIGATTVNDQRQ